MSFQSVSKEETLINANITKIKLESKSKKIATQLDPFLLEDFSLAMEQKYALEIMDNKNGKNASYKLINASINIDELVENKILPLKLEVEEEEDGNTKILDFNVSMVEYSKTAGMENPKYYIYCDNSNEIGFRFWFIQKKN